MGYAKEQMEPGFLLDNSKYISQVSTLLFSISV